MASMRTCEICGKRFEPRGRQRTCSPECKRISYNRYMQNKRYEERYKQHGVEVEPVKTVGRYVCKGCYWARKAGDNIYTCLIISCKKLKREGK